MNSFSSHWRSPITVSAASAVDESVLEIGELRRAVIAPNRNIVHISDLKAGLLRQLRRGAILV